MLVVETIKSVLWIGLRWPVRAVMMIPNAMFASSLSSSPAATTALLRPALFWMAVALVVFGVVCLIFHPILRAVSKTPLLNYLGMTFDDIKITPVKLKLTITDIELLPSRSSLVRSIILSLFPSAQVSRVDDHVGYPESRVTAKKLTVKLRIWTKEGEGSSEDDDDVERGSTTKNFAHHLVPRVMIVVKLSEVSIMIEKAYLAPEPPPEVRIATLASGDGKLPLAIPPLPGGGGGGGGLLPTFHQESVLETIENEEVADADKVTYFVERWIDHVVTKMDRNRRASLVSRGLSFAKRRKASQFHKESQLRMASQLDADAADAGVPSNESKVDSPESTEEAPTEQQTYDENMNAWIHWAVGRVLRIMTLEVEHGSVVISGAGSERVKKTRQRRTPREANLEFARLRRQQRAHTVIGADAISLSFSPDEHCNALFCFVGLHVKVGNPILAAERAGDDASADIPYSWLNLSHPFHLVAELQGVLPFISWAVNYDHTWQSKSLGLSLSSTEVAVNLSPDHLHTLLLHLDDYTDPMSSYNEWLAWLKDTHRLTLEISEHERTAYVHNYSRMKMGTSAGGGKDEDGESEQLTPDAMKDIERRMTSSEIMSLRCAAMKQIWRIPKANKDLEDFLRSSRSSICDDEGHETPLDTLSPFQRQYATPLDALVSLIRANSSLFAPHVAVECSAQILHIDFSHHESVVSKGRSSIPSIPSSINVSGVSFNIDQSNILALDDVGSTASLKSPRPFLDLSLQICAVVWDVLDNTAASHDEEVPFFRGGSSVGMVYMSEDMSPSKPVLSLGLTISVAPTAELEQHFGLSFRTSNLVIVANPLPLLSAIQNLSDLSDLPFLPPDEIISDLTAVGDYEFAGSDASVTPLGVPAVVNVSVQNTQLLFLIDRRRISRGILNLTVHGIDIELESGGLSGKLQLLCEPLVLCAGQILQDQCFQEGRIDTILMPFQPIVDVDGANLFVLGKEEKVHKNGTPKRTDLESAMATLKLNVKLGTESLFFNSSPSTIVAMLGVVSSLDPIFDWAQGEQKAREEERMLIETQKRAAMDKHVKAQREVLLKIFQDVDVDGSGELSEDELDIVILELFSEREEKHTIDAVFKPTMEELKRERSYLLSLMDQNRTNEVTFQELDEAFFKLANKIDDTNLFPKIKDGKETMYNSHFERSDEFLSGPWMTSLIYFDNLREYSSWSEVFRITGQGLESSSTFPMPSSWRLGDGIELFWDLYTRETGCTRQSLNGQNMNLVQRKLVRVLRNYEFAKFCWKTLVQPELSAVSVADEGRDITHWLLDKDSSARIKSGVIDRLLKHVNTEIIKEIEHKGSMTICYDACVAAVVDNAVLRFGSSHTFANPLFQARFSQVKINATTLLSSENGFMPERETATHDVGENMENRNDNHVNFQSIITCTYLNTKHNHMECFIEPYPCFGSVTYKVFAQDSNIHHGNEGSDGAASCSVHLNCPRFLNINTSRSFFETASVLTKVISQADPETFRNLIFERDTNYLQNFWDTRDKAKSGVLSLDEVMEVLRSVAELHWKDELAGLTRHQTDTFLHTFCNLADKDGTEVIAFDNLIEAFKMYTSRCYFTGSREILIKNSIGREMKASTKDNLEDHLMHYSILSESDYQHLLHKVFLPIDDGNSCAIPLSGKLSLVTHGYKIIDDISVSPYQIMMFPLKRKKNSSKRRKRHSNASGFSPHLTVVPKTDSLDSITLGVRTSVYIRTSVPIKIRIVRLGKSVGKNRKHGAKLKIELSKKNLTSALRRAVEGAPIVYERSDLKEGVIAPLPLGVLDSSHYHALLVEWNNSWRDPVLLTKDFLFNPMNIRQVSRCHALSGVVISKERLNVHLSEKHRNAPSASDTKRSILRRTAWDTAIQVNPFFLLSNSLPFPIVVRSWQTSKEDGDELWDEPLVPNGLSANSTEHNSSSDEDISYMTPSIRGRWATPDDIHFSSGAHNLDRYSQDHVAIGKVLPLSGVSLREPLFIQVSQHINASKEADFMWTSPIQVELQKMRTGINQKGQTHLPKIILDLGDSCDCLVDVTVESGTRVPVATIYSPFWLMNKTGARLEYRVAGQKKSYVDSGAGGLPIMIHGSLSQHTNEKYKNVSRSIAVIPLECPNQAVAQNWWDETSNGSLVFPKFAMLERGQSLADWSEGIDLDAAGTNGEINCKRYIFNVQIESLAGAFHRSNLISFTPRFVVKNMLHIAISIMPLFGGVNDVIKKASQLRQGLKELDQKRKLDLAPGESTVLFTFHNMSRGIEKPYHWVTFCVNASRYGASFKGKWHLIPVDLNETHYFGEHDGCFDTMCGILEGKVHGSDTGSRLVSITHAELPPFRIENRSSTHCIRFVQNDAEAVVFELPPLTSAAYTWDSPLGKKKLRAVVVPESKSKHFQLEEALKLERNEETLEGMIKGKHDAGGDSTIETVDSDDESKESGTVEEPLLYSLKKGVRPDARELNKTARYRSPRRKRVYTMDSRSYDMLKVGRQKDLPSPSAQESASGKMMMSSNLFAFMRIVAGTKILSFSDSTWLADQVQAGILRKGGDFKSALFDVNVEGLGLYIMDDYPREVIAVVVRDMQLHKQMGSIEVTAKARHFQVDAMLPKARYPIIIQPLPMGVDRRDPTMKGSDSGDLIIPEVVDQKDCFWRQHDEKPIPVFEVACSWVPQSNMTWVPSLNVFICPLQLHIDVDYILRISNMIIKSVFKYQDNAATNLTATSSANDNLKYITRGQLNICMTYIEKLYINPVYFDIELNIKSDDADDDEDGDSSLMLHSIAQTTNSAAVASILSWVINVGAHFAHVSPTFRYSQEIHTDQYCDIFDLLSEIAKSYTLSTIKQSYKVIFSMQLLGDPSYLIHQWKTGIADLFVKTREEVAVGGKDGVGKGVTSLIQNVGGGTFFAFGKAFGGVADTIDSLTTNDMTSKHLKPTSASSDGRHPDNAIDGLVEGTQFLGQTVVHGIAGLVGNPYRGAKTGTATGLAKGVVSGVTGVVAAPFVGALGFVAKAADGIGATTKYLDIGVIEARCRPARTVPWGRPMSDNGLSYLKAIGIRIHTVRYQKIRRRLIEKDDTDQIERSEDGHVTSKEYKRIRAAEERRKNPPRKVVSIIHEKDKYHYITAPIRPKLLSDAPGNLVLSHYAATFEETLILRSSDLQLGDVVGINFWNFRGPKSTTTRAKPLAVAKFTVGDIHSSVLEFYREQLRQKETNLSSHDSGADSLIVPAPQECALFRPCKRGRSDFRDISDAIDEELAAIKKSDEDNFLVFDSDSSDQSESDSSFLDGGGGGKVKVEDKSSDVRANERLFGSISLSFFPIPW